MSAQTVRFPDISTKPAYEGKFRDRTPFIRPPDSPDIIGRFRATFRPDTGKKTVLYAKANDPHMQWAEDMRHGVHTHPSLTARELVNPDPITLFQQRKVEMDEKRYASSIRAPLGTSHDQTSGLPPKFHCGPTTFVFGNPTKRGYPLREVVNPSKTYAQVEEESAVAHDKYVFTHKDYYVGERVNRRYKLPEYNPGHIYGMPTPHDNTGAKTGRTLRWMYETEKDRASCLISKRLQDYRDKTQPLIGHHHDPMEETMRVEEDHVYGLIPKPDEYTLPDLVHNRVPGCFLRDRDKQRGLVAVMRQHLRNLNYHSFPKLIEAFRFHDKTGTGKIEIDDLREVCNNFNLPVDLWLLEQVFDYLNVDRDGLVDYKVFATFLNWKEKLPPGFAETPYYWDFDKTKGLTTGRKMGKTSNFLGVHASNGDPQTELLPSPRLQSQIDRALANHRTSAAMICAGAGPTGLLMTAMWLYVGMRLWLSVDLIHPWLTVLADVRSSGVPTVRTDLAPPSIRRLSDRQNYGDESKAYSLLTPSVYSVRGVHERDLLVARSQEEVKEIFSRIGVQMTDESLASLYQKVAAENAQGHVSIETFRKALDDMQQAEIHAETHLMAV